MDINKSVDAWSAALFSWKQGQGHPLPRGLAWFGGTMLQGLWYLRRKRPLFHFWLLCCRLCEAASNLWLSPALQIQILAGRGDLELPPPEILNLSRLLLFVVY